MKEKTLYSLAGQVSGKTLQSQLSFTHQYVPNEEELRSLKGSLFSLITLHGDFKARGAEIEEKLYQVFQSTYFASPLGSILPSLEEALSAAKKSLEELRIYPSRLELVGAVLWGEALYVVKVEGAAVLFQRGNTIKELKFHKAASGAVEKEDTIVLANQSFLDQVDISSIPSFLVSEDFQGALKGVDEKIGEIPGAVALILRIYIEGPQAQETLEMMELAGERASILGRLLGAARRLLSLLKARLGPFAYKAKNLFLASSRSLLDKILEPWRARSPGEIEEVPRRRRARAAQVAVVMVVLLVASVSFALVNRAASEKKARFEEKLQTVSTKLDEVENLALINPGRSRDLISEAEKDIDDLRNLGVDKGKVEEVYRRFNALVMAVKKISEVSLDEVYSFPSEVKINKLILAGNKFLVLDKTGKKIFILDKNKKTVEDLVSEAEVNTISLSENTLYLQNAAGIEKIDINSKVKVKAQGSSSDWGEIVEAATYQGNLYLLDKGKKEIWKYLNLGSSLASAQRYFKDSSDKGVLSGMAIDGAIWVIDEEGALMKFLGGKRQDFEVSNLDEPFGNKSYLYTEIGSDTLFVLDKNNGRVVLIGKDGSYVSQYKSEDFSKAEGLAVVEKGREVFIGVGNTIKRFKYGTGNQ
ncbi:MAG: hypothetical protein WD231_05475 [Candidatus Woykebacteria bacterium]